VVTEVSEKVAALRTARDGDDLEAIKSASEALSTSLSKIGEAMMKDQQAGAGEATTEGASAEGAAPEAGATDAEFTEKPEGEAQ
ncbi:MAG: molecular chaperone DnaK, partial [Candidatus Paceibacterota bacterium]